jgi:hypothetical protein
LPNRELDTALLASDTAGASDGDGVKAEGAAGWLEQPIEALTIKKKRLTRTPERVFMAHSPLQ